jgi:hypothetical protein
MYCGSTLELLWGLGGIRSLLSDKSILTLSLPQIPSYIKIVSVCSGLY